MSPAHEGPVDGGVDVAIIGAGPAGIAAAVAARASGARVVLLDEGRGPGGQIWRPGLREHRPAGARRWLARLDASGAEVRSGTTVVDIGKRNDGFGILVQSQGGSRRLHARRVILANGARERFLPFDGWTLPGVVGVGGAQALLEAGAHFQGKRVVIGGTGPLLLQVAASLRAAGAQVRAIAEQAPAGRIRAFAIGLWRRPSILAQAARLRGRLAGVPYRQGWWISRANGGDRLRSATITNGSDTQTIECDFACVAFGLVPNSELARLAGCEATRDGVTVDDLQQTSIPDLYCAGEPTGVGGVDLSLAEGAIAGFAASGQPERARKTVAARDRLRRYARALDEAFALRDELRMMASQATIVCRCEDVPLAAIDAHWSARQAKLYTRAGMGPCQGRICGAALEWMFGWPADSVRPPAQPARVATLIAGGSAAGADSHESSTHWTIQRNDWQGVLPAITTPFLDDLSVDHERLRRHVVWLTEKGCRGIVALGSLGEAATLAFEEKVSILESIRNAVGNRVPVVAGIAGLSTAECVALAKRAEKAGCDGLMVLPPYVYRGDWPETRAHFEAVITATKLACMLYNNPIAYGTDVSPAQLGELLRHENLQAVKESSGDVRRVTAMREQHGDRFALCAGMDDAILESIPMGARGWVAGLVNAFPSESIRLVDAACAGRFDEARKIYEWFLPLLRLDTVPKFVQLIKVVQSEVGQGNARVRPPRLELSAQELAEVRALVRAKLAARP